MHDNNLDLLPVYSFFIHPLDLRELRRDIWIDDPVPAKLNMNKKIYDIDLAYRGNHIREFAKKSYFVTFEKPKTFEEQHELHLNAEYLDASLIRSKLSFDFFQMIGVLAPATRHVLVKINGKMAGIYLEIESVDRHFFKKRNIPVNSIYYAINSDANFSFIRHKDHRPKTNLISGYECKFGNNVTDEQLKEFIYKINTIPYHEFPNEITKYLNVDQFLRWLAGVVCIQNFDAFHQNYSLFQHAETRLFEMIPWDNEATWGRDCNGDIMEYNYIPVDGDHTNTLANKILGSISFRKKYKALLEEILETTFTPEFLYPKIISLKQLLYPHLSLDPYIRHSRGKLEAELEMIFTYIRDRRDYLQRHLKDLKC